MAFILIPANGDDIVINAWNWRPTLELLLHAELIDDDLYERMGTHGARPEVDAARAERIALYLERRLKSMKAGERIRADLSVTDKPKERWVITADTKIDEIDGLEMYSATYEWLLQFKEFCRLSGGFRVS